MATHRKNEQEDRIKELEADLELVKEELRQEQEAHAQTDHYRLEAKEYIAKFAQMLIARREAMERAIPLLPLGEREEFQKLLDER